MPTFVQALNERYGAADTTDYGAEAFHVASANPKKKMKQWEMVGLEQAREKQSQHHRLAVVALPNRDIDRVCTEELEQVKLVRVQDLDLSRNPLDMGSIETIAGHLPSLRELQLNKIALPQFAIARPAAWNSVHTLTLNESHVQWCSVVSELQALPALKALHLEKNDFETLAPLPKGTKLPNVEILNLASNQLRAWGMDHALLDAFPALSDLRLHDNALEMPGPASASSSSGGVLYLQRLKALWISGNAALVGLPVLAWVVAAAPQATSLRVTYATLFPGFSEAQARMLTVAALPQLLSLNNGAVRPKERVDAEMFYLQRALTRSNEGGLDAAAAEYPRIADLKVKFASVLTTVDGKPTGTVGEGAMAIMLRLRLQALGKSPIEKTLPSSLTVGKLKSLIAAQWPELTADKQRLVFFAAVDAGAAPPAPLDGDFQTLSYFGVGQDAIVEVREM